MLLTPHTFIGIAIGTLVPNPLIAVPLAFSSHFLADKVPHWDFFTNATDEQIHTHNWRTIACQADLAVGVATGMFFSLQALWVQSNLQLALTVFLCGIAAVLPDALTAPALYSYSPPKLSKTLAKVQIAMNTPAKFFPGILTQIVAVTASLLVILHSAKLL